MIIIFSRTRRAMFKGAFRYIQHFHTVCEKGFRMTLEKDFSWNKHFFQRFRQNILRVGYLKKSKFFIFSCIFLDIRVVRPPFFRGRVEPCLEKLINTFNNSIRYVKKFLDWILLKFSFEKHIWLSVGRCVGTRKTPKKSLIFSSSWRFPSLVFQIWRSGNLDILWNSSLEKLSFFLRFDGAYKI